MAMTVRLGFRALRLPADIVIATSPSLFVGLAGWLVAALRRVPLVWDLRDLTWSYVWEDARYPGWLRVSSTALRWLARFIARSAALVSVSNQGIRREILSFGVPEHRTLLTPNGVSSEIIELGRALPPKATGKNPTVTYGGALGYYQGLSTLLEVAALLPEVRFVIAGDGPERPALVRAVKAQRLSNVELAGYVSRGELFSIYGGSDVLFAQLRDLPVLSDATFPSKPFEYMAAGRPIVYAGRGITADFLESVGCALIAEPENPASIRSQIQVLLGDRDLANRLAKAGSEAAPNYRRDKVMRSFAQSVNELLTS